MSVRDALMLEARVAFSRKAQPIWFRVLKWAIAIGVGWYLRRDPHFWWWILAALGLAVAVHLGVADEDQTVDTGLGRVARS